LTKIRVTERVNAIDYAPRALIAHANEIAESGKKVLYLNMGDPVAFDFATPDHVKQALIEAVEKGNNEYSPSEGLPELREAISRREKQMKGVDVSPGEVLVTNGVSEGIQMVMAALVDAGDEVLIPGPAYPPYLAYTKFFGGEPVTYETVEEEDWNPNFEDLRSKISDKTRSIVIINPNNPCGAVYNRKVLKQITDLAGEYGIPVLSDEIYDGITYEEVFHSTAQVAEDVPVIVLNGFSKTYLMTGLRLGYLYLHGDSSNLEDLKQCVIKETRVRLCANTPVQRAGIAALQGPQDHIKSMVHDLRKRRDYTCKRVEEIDGLTSRKPKGAFYIFPRITDIGERWRDDYEWVQELLNETGVLLVQGSGFDPVYGSGHFRSVFLPPLEILEEAFDKIEGFMKT
jgi:alanine-synthesizing transaminase